MSRDDRFRRHGAAGPLIDEGPETTDCVEKLRGCRDDIILIH
jgi:hypothetical protein